MYYFLCSILYWIENGLLEKRLTWLLNYMLSHVLEISYFPFINAGKWVLLDIVEGCVREGGSLNNITDRRFSSDCVNTQIIMSTYFYIIQVTWWEYQVVISGNRFVLHCCVSTVKNQRTKMSKVSYDLWTFDLSLFSHV